MNGEACRSESAASSKTLRWLLALALPTVLYAACDDEGKGSTRSDGEEQFLYKGSDCEACDKKQCGVEHSACNADVACAPYITCLEKCEIGPSGDAAASCESACAEATQGDLVDAFRACRTEGAGTACIECGREPIAEGGGGAGGGGGGTCGEHPEIADECIRCDNEKCCESYDLVFNTPGPVKDVADCWFACNDSACDEACFAMYPDGIEGFGTWVACHTTECYEPEGPCTADPCNECIYEECEAEVTACFTDPECFVTWDCYALCTTTACAAACLDEHPEGAVLHNQYSTCVVQRCGSQCGG